MSSSPTRYNDSRPSSRPTSPQNAAEVRSQAVAKLKRAASLPRRTDTRRPSNDQQANAPAPVPARNDNYDDGTPGNARDAQEVLSPSPIHSHFEIHEYPPVPVTHMQRSVSASSSYHAPTPTHLGGFSQANTPLLGYSGTASPMPDWSAMSLAQSYLPSLSPIAVQHSPFIAPLPVPVPMGRNTPSPLPTLGELRTLQRSNSAAARARAMDKLTGGRETPVQDDLPAESAGRISHHRADSVGASQILESGGLSQSTSSMADHPPSSFVDPRPKLQRSFTVSSSNMGEERRSAVGRRMVARLGERRGTEKKDDMDIRKMWEARTGHTATDEDVAVTDDDGHGEGDDDEEDVDGNMSGPGRHLPTAVTRADYRSPPTSGGLSVPEDDRSVSRNTQMSEGDAFEYESHLRRSLSSRTARGGVVGTVTEAVPPLQPSPPEEEQLEHAEGVEYTDNYGQYHAETQQDLERPQPQFATPARNTLSASTSTGGAHSPGSGSVDGLNSMMFVVGSGTDALGDKRGTTGYPVDVADGETGSWGTPAKTNAFDIAHHSPTPAPLQTDASPADDGLTPPGLSARSSVMSWEELGGEADREIPVDQSYHKKSGSISAKMGRAVKGAIRKRSQSRDSNGSASSPPTSPKSIGEALTVAVQSFGSRRGSQSSVAPSHASTARTVNKESPMNVQSADMRHQPSVSSLAPSTVNESSANSLLLQHQLSNDPQVTRDMPRAKIDDPRVFNSKLSPFPGVEKRGADSLAPPEMPKLLQQSSDSAVPSQQRVTPHVVDSIHSLPLPVHLDESRRASDDSTTKKGWLAKAFAAAATPTGSGYHSRKSSFAETAPQSRRGSADRYPAFAGDEATEADPFAGPPPPVINLASTRSRAISPSVSTVAEVNEEGSRMTQFTTHRSVTHTPAQGALEEAHHDSHHARASIPAKSLEVLQRMDAVLALGPDDAGRPDILDDPPRKLLLATQVLQVVNIHTAKDRFLFLFNDILVICKPVFNQGGVANLDMQFIVKSIVALDKLHVSGFTDEPSAHQIEHRDHLVKEFVAKFAEDPVAASSFLIERNHWRDDLVSLASVIFKTPELEKLQIGQLLAGEEALMKAFIDLFHFTGVRIDEALRMFLLSLQLPGDPTAAERLLRGLAYRYFDANKDHLSFDKGLAAELVLSMMQLNDSLHEGQYGFAMHNPHLTAPVYTSAFREKDPRGMVDDQLLHSVYQAINDDQLSPPLHASQSEKARKVVIKPERLTGRLTYNIWSEAITIQIPAPDSAFAVKLLGDGFEFDPPLLSFANSKEASFRVKGTSLGPRSVLFVRVGENAPLYGSLGNAKVFNVERAFMRHTFHIAFANHVGIKRKYCFSVPDAELRTKWGVLLPRQMAITRQKRSVPVATQQQKIRQAAEIVSLHVLRDALIAPPELGQSGKPKIERTGSISVAYTHLGGRSEEAALGPLVANKLPTEHYDRSGRNTPAFGGHEQMHGLDRERTHGMMDETTGKEVVLVCRQNSLLPGMLELLQAGMEPKSQDSRAERERTRI